MDMDLVRKLRNRKGWSQEHLAAASGLGKATIQRVESGRCVPSPETAQSLAAALGVDANRIRVHAGLAAALNRVMRILLDRDPAANELQRLPARVRTVLTSFCDARRELAEAQSTLMNTFQQTTGAMDAVLHVVTAFNQVLVSALGKPPNSETLERLRFEQRRAEEAQSTHATCSSAVHAATQRSSRANEVFAEAGLELTHLLLTLA